MKLRSGSFCWFWSSVNETTSNGLAKQRAFQQQRKHHNVAAETFSNLPFETSGAAALFCSVTATLHSCLSPCCPRLPATAAFHGRRSLCCSRPPSAAASHDYRSSRRSQLPLRPSPSLRSPVTYDRSCGRSRGRRLPCRLRLLLAATPHNRRSPCRPQPPLRSLPRCCPRRPFTAVPPGCFLRLSSTVSHTVVDRGRFLRFLALAVA